MKLIHSVILLDDATFMLVNHIKNIEGNGKLGLNSWNVFICFSILTKIKYLLFVFIEDSSHFPGFKIPLV